ncbi:hypothetical protein LTR56_002725 [Elasticomyces elasticus]|nr:hypothetical protein LTR56_002725 [Elasticomyces elasticus]KAK3666818.1 hypothetical protein LTR22_002405 [Elasticomyces elasticus]KAK4918842.1 hypothetical protein LTR49_013473 [Elasticomyces elasticus]KAK5758759.1 hypothetical protein LTS12_011153 [Elasticomyces elasticus]
MPRSKKNSDVDWENSPSQPETFKWPGEGVLADPRISPAEDMFMKLSPELRNKIYELVLVTSHVDVEPYLNGEPYHGKINKKLKLEYRSTVTVEPICVHFRKHQERRRWPSESSRWSRWQEPGLLRASKWIRQEAKLMYYRSAPIKISLHTGDITEVYCWLSNFADGDKQQWLGHVDFWFSSGEWESIHSWWLLAALFYDYNFGHTLEFHEERTSHRKYQNEDQVFGGHNQIVRALHQVITLGLKAKELGRSFEELAIDFGDWLEATLDGRVLVSSVQKRRKLAENIEDLHRQAINFNGKDVEQAALADGFRYQESKIEHRGQPQMKLRSS